MGIKLVLAVFVVAFVSGCSTVNTTRPMKPVFRPAMSVDVYEAPRVMAVPR